MSHDEPDYLKALRKAQERTRQAGRSATEGRGPQWSLAEQEALRWAREVAGQDVRPGAALQGARFVILAQPKTWDGKAPIMLDGFPTEDALLSRYEAATSYGDKVLGCYEVPSARPLAPETQGGRTTFTPGKPRKIAKPLSPEQMIRKAAMAAETKAKMKPKGRK